MIAWIKVTHRAKLGRGPRNLQSCAIACDAVDALRKLDCVRMAEHFSTAQGNTGKGCGYIVWIDVLFDHDGTDQIAQVVRDKLGDLADSVSLIL